MNDPEVNKLIDSSDANPDLDAVAPDYAKADKLVVDHAYIAPYGNRELTKLVSDKVDFASYVAHPVYNGDFSLLKLK